jgi:hypothetical protein
MSTKIIRTVIAAVCAVALMAAPAYASGGQRSTVVMNLVPSGDASAACPGSVFGLAFDLTSPSGKRLGTGRSCIASIDGCDPFQPRCHQTVRATLTFDLAHGSVTVRATLLEVLPDESSFVQLGHGTVAGGTGAYGRATGRLDGGGAGRFTEQGFEGRIVYALQLRNVRRPG